MGKKNKTGDRNIRGPNEVTQHLVSLPKNIMSPEKNQSSLNYMMEQPSSSPKKIKDFAEVKYKSSFKKEKYHGGSLIETDDRPPSDQSSSPKKKKKKKKQEVDEPEGASNGTQCIYFSPKKHSKQTSESNLNDTLEEPAAKKKKKKHKETPDVSFEKESRKEIEDVAEMNSEPHEESVVKKKNKKRKGNLDTTENDDSNEVATYFDESLGESVIKKKKKKHKDVGLHSAEEGFPRKGARKDIEAVEHAVENPGEFLDDSVVKKKKKKKKYDGENTQLDLSANTEAPDADDSLVIPSLEDSVLKKKKEKRKRKEKDYLQDISGIEELSSKKKNEREVLDQSLHEIPEESRESEILELEPVVKKKKKSRKHEQLKGTENLTSPAQKNSLPEIPEESLESEILELEPVVKKKKKSRKHEELEETGNSESTAQKKRKRTEDHADQDLHNVSTELLEEPVMKKKKKKKHREGDLTVDISVEQAELDSTENPVEKRRKKQKKHPVLDDEIVMSPVNNPAQVNLSAEEKSEQINASVAKPEGSNQKFACSTCSKEFLTLWLLRCHSEDHGEQQYIYCEVCDAAYISTEDLDLHYGTHGQKKFACKSCDAKFFILVHFTEHVRSHAKNPYQCGCGQSYSRKDNLIRHQGKKGTYGCEFCDATFEINCLLALHRATHDDKTFECEYCSRKFSTLGYLKQHLKAIHSTESSVEHKCVQCGKKLLDAFNLKRHIATCHSEEYKCDCGKVFSSKRLLGAHKKTHILGKFQCELCNKTYAYKYKLDSHLAVHGEKKFQCEQCGEKFWFSYQLKKHISGKCEKNTFTCEDCGNSYQTNRELDQHSITHEVGNFECKICEGKRFATLHELALHSSKVHKSQKPYKCPECEKDFAARSKFYLHMETHGEKRYKCQTCDKSFYHLRNLDKHKVIHKKVSVRKWPEFHCEHCDDSFLCLDELKHHSATHGERKYVCEVCGEKFFYPDVFARHQQLHRS